MKSFNYKIGQEITCQNLKTSKTCTGRLKTCGSSTTTWYWKLENSSLTFNDQLWSHKPKTETSDDKEAEDSPETKTDGKEEDSSPETKTEESGTA